ncbi:37801_t:CDS:2, partial [Gigaspora margarita]
SVDIINLQKRYYETVVTTYVTTVSYTTKVEYTACPPQKPCRCYSCDICVDDDPAFAKYCSTGDCTPLCHVFIIMRACMRIIQVMQDFAQKHSNRQQLAGITTSSAERTPSTVEKKRINLLKKHIHLLKKNVYNSSRNAIICK